VRLACPLCGTLVADGAEPEPGDCPGCGARYAGGGESPPDAVTRALARWGVEGLDPMALARRLFEVDAPPPPAPAAAITSDRRDGFYLWWLFVRGAGDGPEPVLSALVAPPAAEGRRRGSPG
jgi:hypothetical protein